jgi:hypothetical protein
VACFHIANIMLFPNQNISSSMKQNNLEFEVLSHRGSIMQLAKSEF